MKSIRVKDLTPEQRRLCSCDVCGEVIQVRGWANPERVRDVRKYTGGYAHGRCMK